MRILELPKINIDVASFALGVEEILPWKILQEYK